MNDDITEIETDEPEDVVENQPESDNPEEVLVGAVQVEIDESALKAGFEYPFTLIFKPSKKAKKGDLLKEVVNSMLSIPEQPPAYRQSFKRWICKNFNVAEAIFNDPTTLGQELAMVEQSLHLKNENKPYVLEQSEPVEVVTVGDNEEEETQPDFITMLGG